LRIESKQWEAAILTRWSTKLRTKLAAVFRPLILFVAAVAYVIESCDATERTIAVARSDCRLAVEHAATADVDFEAGVDVHGQPVPPADVGRAGVGLPDIVSVFVSAEVRNTFQLGDDSPLLSFDAGIGVVEYELSSGRLLFNGVPLSERDEQALAALCREARPR
jgi:hypothetical protein